MGENRVPWENNINKMVTRESGSPIGHSRDFRPEDNDSVNNRH